MTEIGASLFYGNIGITEVVLGNGLTKIPEYAFYGCSGLKSIIIPDSVTGIEKCAFEDCTGLQSLNLGENVITIGDYAFESCSMLKYVFLPENVRKIGRQAFVENSRLTSFVISNPDCIINDSADTISNGYSGGYYYSGTIYGYENSTAQSYAEKYDYKFNVYETNANVAGDCNADGFFSVADAVLLQRWLLADGTKLADWEAADLCKDGRLDSFDLCLMKEALLN